MKSLDEMTSMEGVVMATEFGPDGKLLDYRAKGDFPRELAEKSAQYSSTVTNLFNILGESFTKVTGTNWVPQHCWHYAGGDWTVVVAGDRALMIETQKADMQSIMRMVMAETEEVGGRI
jgi:roadblock/LC7 domain-containing protein